MMPGQCNSSIFRQMRIATAEFNRVHLVCTQRPGHQGAHYDDTYSMEWSEKDFGDPEQH